MSLRGIYYALPPKMRLLARKLVYFPIDLIRKEKYANGLPVPPRSLIYTGSGDFKATGHRFLQYFIKYGLKRNDDFLDIGSGIGRIALPLTGFLNGSYVGLDIMKVGVNWCTEHISKAYPNFSFIKLDVKNDLYQRAGHSASDITFPVDRNFFDYSCLISVFTHMLPDEVENYLHEINKSLKSGGICFATFFIFQSDIDLETNHFKPFIKQDSHYALMDEKVTSANVAYEESFLLSMFQRTGFELVHLSRGKWIADDSSDDFQDFVVLRKI